MKLIFVFVLVCLTACLVSGGESYYDPDYCDPFPKNAVMTESSCYSDMAHGSNEEGLIINPLFLAQAYCPAGLQERFVNRTINRIMGPPKPVIEWTFTYSVKWTDANTNCVLGPSDIGLDQNGLSNDPLTDISAFALNQWYTRSFNIEAGRSLNFSFVCATNVNNTDTIHPYAMIKDVKWKMGSIEEFSYKPEPCYRCPAATVPYAQCLPNGPEDIYGRSERNWVYDGTYWGIVETGVNLNVTGSVVTNKIYLSGALFIGGCLIPLEENSTKIELHIVAGRPAMIFMAPSCPVPDYEVIPMAYYQFPNMPNKTDCDNFTYDPKRIIISGTPPSTFYIDGVTCLHPTSSAAVTQIIVVAVVLSVIFLIGIAVGVFFAVKQHREGRAKKERDEKSAKRDVTAKKTKTDMESPMSLPTTAAMNDDVSDAAVQH